MLERVLVIARSVKKQTLLPALYVHVISFETMDVGKLKYSLCLAKYHAMKT